MNALAHLQQAFIGGLLGDSDGVLHLFSERPGFDARQRFAIYANAYRRRLVEAIASVYERCATVMGEEAFEAVASAYVEHHPPRDAMLRRYATDFPEWLEARDDVPAFAADLAAIDRGLRNAFDAADERSVDRQPLLHLDPGAWPGLRFLFAAALSFARVRHGSVALWRGEASAHEANPGPSGPAVDLVFWRDDGRTFFRSLPAVESRLMRALHAGEALAEACAHAGTHDTAIDAATAVPLLLGWLDAGWITDFDDGSTSPGP